MKSFRLSFFILQISAIFILTGCARWGGDNPLGITGGSEGGYGQNNNLSLADSSVKKEIDPELVDTWYRYRFYMIGEITFNANGTFHAEGDITINQNQSIDGTFYTFENTITLNWSRESYQGTYSIIEDQLTITITEESIVFYRDNVIIN